WLLFSGTEVKLILAEQPLGPFYSLLYSLQTSFTPFVELVYEPPVEVWFDPVRITVSLLLTGILVYFVRRKSDELGRPACFWGAWFLLLILPTSNILEQECVFSERYVFLAMLAPLALAAAIVSQYWERFLVRKLFLIAGLLAGVCLACISSIRGFYFENEETFFRQWVNTNSRSPTAHVHLGLVYASHGQFAEAIACYERALAIDPEFTGALINQANALVTMQQYDTAIQLYEQSLKLLDGKLRHLKVGVYHNLGNAWWGKQNAERAIQEYERAIELSREHLPSYLALADIYLQQDQPAHAARYLNEALKLKSATKQKQREIHSVMQRFQLE
ncbi:MAG: tetratricopeptide repeat protein, partial [Planctomycetaceae bacterium]|nr:tetratricopeptide repeat protein [Planctomycetaceae bacterium]